MLRCIILISLLLINGTLSEEYGLLFKHDKSYFQTSYITLCDESTIKFEVLFNRTSGILFYAENRLRGVRLELYFDRPGVYAKVSDGTMIYILSLTLDVFNSVWFSWHEIEIRINKFEMNIIVDGRVKKVNIKGNYFFPEDLVEENEIYFGVSPRWTITKNVTGFSGYMRNILYKSCGCNEWRSVALVKIVGVSTEHLGDCKMKESCKKGCNCHLFPWGSKRCECHEEKCHYGSSMESYDFEKSYINRGRLHLQKISNDISYKTGIKGYGIEINGKAPVMMFVARGRSCFKNIFLCEEGFTYSFWILPKVTYNSQIPSLILKHSSTIQSNHGLTITRQINNVFVSLITNDGLQFEIRSPLQLSVWSLVTIIYNKTHLCLYINSYLKDSIAKSKQIDVQFPDLPSTRFLYIGNNETNPYVIIDNFTFTSDIDIPRLPSIQELRLEQHSTFRKINYDCINHIDQTFVNLIKCYKRVFQAYFIYYYSEFYMSILFNLQMERSKMILVQSTFINITSESYKALHLDLRAQPRQTVKLKVASSRLYHVEISINEEGELIVIQNLDIILLKVTLPSYTWRHHKGVTEILVNKDRNSLSDIRLINVNREFATRALRIITGDINSYSVDFDRTNIDEYDSLPLIEGYIGQGLELKYPLHFVSADWFSTACLKYIASCYHGLTISFYIKLLNDFQHFNKPFFNVFSSGDQGLSLMIEKQGYNFIMKVETDNTKKFIPSVSSFELYQWCLVEISVSPNGFASLILNGKEARKVPFTKVYQNYECSKICLGDKHDQETNVIMIIDEIRTWNVERDFLYSNGILVSDPQSLLQQQKNYEEKITLLKVKNKSLVKERMTMTEELEKLKLELATFESKMNSFKCKESLKGKDAENRNQTYSSNMNANVKNKKTKEELKKTSECENLFMEDSNTNLTEEIIKENKTENQENEKQKLFKIKTKIFQKSVK